MPQAASRNSWKNLKFPSKREKLDFSGFFYDADAERLMLGFVPKDIDDKWFIFFEEGWLYFHRSTTGLCIFALHLDGSPAGVRVIDSWVCRDSDEYNAVGREEERKLVRRLIDTHLLV